MTPDGAPPAEGRILVCVGASPTSARLIRAAHRLAQGLGVGWLAVTVEAPDAYAMDREDRARRDAHLRLAESLGGEVARLAGRHVSDEIIRFARERGVSRILVGKPTLRRFRDLIKPPLVNELVRKSGALEIHFIAGDELPPPMVAPRPRNRPTAWADYLLGLALVTVTTLVAGLGEPHLSRADTVMLFLLPIMVTALRAGRGPSLTATTLAVACYDFFFVPPYWTFRVSDDHHLLTFAIMFAVGIAISTLMVRIREQGQEARERERQGDALHALSRDMIAMLDASGAAGIIARHAARQFGGEGAVYLLDGDVLAPCGAQLRPPLTTAQEALVHWVCQQRQAAGRGTLLQPEQPITCLPLATSRCLGVLVLRRREGFDGDQGRFLEAFVRQASLALDRARLSEEARSAVLRARSEEMRGVLLSMASHDLHTPLAAITGAGTALRDEAGLSAEQRLELVETLCIEAERMERLVSNLLEMVRLESGGCHLRPEWVPFEELAGSALSRLERRCQGREVVVTVDESIPMVYVDPVIFEQVLINLLDNALKYTPEGSPLAWSVTRGEGGAVLLLQDRGPGIPAGEEARIFEKFTRGKGGGVPGAGLGLAICQGIVQAHGGAIRAGNREGGGAVFRIDLPQPPPPPDIPWGEEMPHG